MTDRPDGTAPATPGESRGAALTRGLLAFPCAVASVLGSGFFLSCYALWTYSFVSGDKTYLLFGHSTVSFLRRMTDVEVLASTVGIPLASATMALIARGLTRPERAAKGARRGTMAWVASRFGRLGWLMSILDLMALTGFAAYRVYSWGWW